MLYNILWLERNKIMILFGCLIGYLLVKLPISQVSQFMFGLLCPVRIPMLINIHSEIASLLFVKSRVNLQFLYIKSNNIKIKYDI